MLFNDTEMLGTVINISKRLPLSIAKKTFEKIGSGMGGFTGKITGNLIYSVFIQKKGTVKVQENATKCAIRTVVKEELGLNPATASLASMAYNVVNLETMLDFSKYWDDAKMAFIVASAQGAITPLVESGKEVAAMALPEYPTALFLTQCVIEGSIRGTVSSCGPLFCQIVDNYAGQVQVAEDKPLGLLGPA